MITLTALYFGASGYEVIFGSKYFGALYTCYGVANILLMIVAMKVGK